jgi:hypothetical protein
MSSTACSCPVPTTIGEQSRKGGGSENFFHATVIVHLREKK